jgi:hypothetical protein
MCIEEGSYDGEETVSGVDFGQRSKTVTWPWQVGPTRQRGEERSRVPVRDELSGPRASFRLWAEGGPEAFLYFFLFFSSFLFFRFLYLFITFAFVVQKTSNQIVIFSKIPSNSPEQ